MLTLLSQTGSSCDHFAAFAWVASLTLQADLPCQHNPLIDDHRMSTRAASSVTSVLRHSFQAGRPHPWAPGAAGQKDLRCPELTLRVPRYPV